MADFDVTGQLSQNAVDLIVEGAKANPAMTEKLKNVKRVKPKKFFVDAVIELEGKGELEAKIDLTVADGG